MLRNAHIERTAYPNLLVNITDQEVTSRYTLSYEELELVKSYRGNQLSLAVRLKLFEHSLSHNLPLSEVPQKVIDYVASQLQVLPEQLSESKDSRSDQIQLIRQYTGFSPFISEEADKLKAWLQIEAEKYFEALSTRYSFVRRFTPLIWENLTFRSNTSDDTLIRAIEYLKENLQPSLPELPVKGALVDFVPNSWDRHVFVRQRNSRKILSINKSMYEMCIVEQLIDKIIASEIAVESSQYYSSLDEYLISKEEFLAKREYYIQKLKLPSTADTQLKSELERRLDYMNQYYEMVKPYTKVSRGSLSFSRMKKEVQPPRIEELTAKIAAHLKPVSIIDILVDVDKLTGFFSLFETVGYREKMTKEQKAERMVATLLCYGICLLKVTPYRSIASTENKETQNALQSQ